jgi:hypothetical protein
LIRERERLEGEKEGEREQSSKRERQTEKQRKREIAKDGEIYKSNLNQNRYSRHAPPKSFIHVDDFASPHKLAKYLLFLDSNDTS